MATLSSIPESHPEASHTRRRAPPGRNTASFERVRPRSRVIILSRRPARRRRSGHRSSPGAAHHPSQASNASSTKDSGLDYRTDLIEAAADPCARMKDAPKSTFQPVGAISDRDLSSYEGLVPFLNIPPPLQSHPQKDGPCDLRHTALPVTIEEQPRNRVSPLSTPPPASGHRKQPEIPTDLRENIGQNVDGIIDYATGSPLHSNELPGVDQRLVEAVTRNVVQQLRLGSATNSPKSQQYVSETSRQPSSDPYDNPSRTSSQRVALDRFTKELQRYAEHTSAKGRLPLFTPTPTRSGGTLHTVSELLPFRPEFKAAGLAVTSRDQAQQSLHPTRASAARAVRRQPIKSKARQSHLSQMDGNEASGGTTTEISFVSPTDANDWRYALIDDVSPGKEKSTIPKSESRMHCLPCFPTHDDQTTDRECSPELQRSLLTKSRPKAQKPSLHSSSRRPERSALMKVENNGLLTDNHGSRAVQTANSDIAARVRHPTEPALRRRRRETLRQKPPPRSGSRQPARTLGHHRSSIIVKDSTIEPKYRKYSFDPAGDAPRHENPRAMERPEPPNTAQMGHLDHVGEPMKRRNQSLPARQMAEYLARMPEGSNSLPNLHRDAKLKHQPVQAGDAVSLRSIRGETGPVKASPMTPRIQSLHPDTTPARQKVTLCSRVVAGRPHVRPNIPRRTSSIRGSLHSLAMDGLNGNIIDRDVLRGLHIAASAACDEEIDAFISRKTGLQIRRFLADLMALENLGDEKPDEEALKRAMRRRSELKMLKQHMRRSRQLGNQGGLDP